MSGICCPVRLRQEDDLRLAWATEQVSILKQNQNFPTQNLEVHKLRFFFEGVSVGGRGWGWRWEVVVEGGVGKLMFADYAMSWVLHTLKHASWLNADISNIPDQCCGPTQPPVYGRALLAW